MGVLPDHWIQKMSRTRGMIEPFAPSRVRKGRISYGLSSYGYDFRLAAEFWVPDFSAVRLLDPKRSDVLTFRRVRGRSCTIPANSYIIGRSLEYFRVPRDILVICQGKSTYARSGISVNLTPFEPEWEGYATICIVNTAPVQAVVYSGEGIAQMIFMRAEEECRVSYADRKGKYQSQKRIELAKV